jgi:hypothetical protein
VTKSKVGRKERRRLAAQQQKRRRALTIGLPIILGVTAIIALFFIRNAGGDIEGVLDFGAQERDHDEGVVYEDVSLPPVGGVHSPRWQNCGIYDQPVEVKNAVHSMEHGAVWIAYNPSLPAEEVDLLRDNVQGQSYLLLTPYPNLDGNVVLTAWGVQLQVDSAADERVAQFIDQYRLGPQTPEFGAACDGGIGSPIG